MQEIFLLMVVAQGCGMPVATPARRAELVVSAESLARHVREPNLVVLNTDMMPDDFRRAHIPGARWADAHHFAPDGPDGTSFELPAVSVLDSLIESLGIANDSRVVLYGDADHIGRVFLALEYAGLAGRVAILDGGLAAWRAAGQPTTAATAPPRRRAFEPHPTPGIVIGTDELQGHLRDRRLVLIDARSPAEYRGTDAGHRERRGHIPGAVSLDWARTFAGPDKLASDVELRRLFRDAHVTADRDLVIYCTVGMRAAHLFFIARYLGYQPRIYDGSIQAWSRRADLPLKTGDQP